MAQGTGRPQSGRPALTSDKLADLVKHVQVGKRVGGDVYIHRDALARHDPTLLRLVSGYAAAGEDAFDWNVCKLSPHRHRISLLHYPCFRKQAHPALAAALTVDLSRGTTRVRRYSERGNRPILHRKELFVDIGRPRLPAVRGTDRTGRARRSVRNTLDHRPRTRMGRAA